MKGYIYPKGRQAKAHKSVSVFNNPKPYSSGGTPIRSYPASKPSLGSRIVKGIGSEIKGTIQNMSHGSFQPNSIENSLMPGQATKFGAQQKAGTFHKSKKHKKGKNWIAKATENKGGLHRALGVKQGKKLTSKQLARGKKMGGKTAKEVALAKTLKGFKHKKHKVMCKKHKRMHCKTCG